MKVKWRKDKIGKHHELWAFWGCGKYFSCICLLTHKKRRPRRIFLRFAKHRLVRRNFESIDNGLSFLVEKKFIYKKSIE